MQGGPGFVERKSYLCHEALWESLTRDCNRGGASARMSLGWGRVGKHLLCYLLGICMCLLDAMERGGGGQAGNSSIS